MFSVFVFSLVLFSMHFFLPLAYYLSMKGIATRSWGLTLDDSYTPSVTLIISTFNEARVIRKKLDNLKKLEYPSDKLQVIIVDGASPDGTAEIVNEYITTHNFPFNILVLKEKERRGKAKALNFALQHAKGEIIATSDADSFWDPFALRKALPFLASSQVGALTGREVITNIDRNVHTLAEAFYGNFNRTIKLGESKIYSTLIFQGELLLYKRTALKKFEDSKGSDDIGTVINILSGGHRTIFVPNAIFYDAAHYSLKGKMTVKIRRAQHLIYGVWRAVDLKLKKKLSIPTPIVFMNLYLYVLNPIIGLLFLVILSFLILSFPLLLLVAPLVLYPKRLRTMIVSYVTGNLALFLAMIRCATGDKQLTWKKIDETRY